MKVVKSHAGRRTVEVEGTASQFSKAFGVAFAHYQAPARPERREKKLPARIKTYRGRDGFVHVPKELSEIILGVFGLDNRPVSHRANNPGDPDMVNPITVQQATSLYNFPLPGAAISGQTIGIIAPHNGYGGDLQSDLNQTYSAVGLTAPNVIPIPVDSVLNGTSVATTAASAAVGDSVLHFAATPSTLLVNSFGQYTAASTTFYFLVTAVTATTVTCEAADPSTCQRVTTGFFVAVPLGTVIYFNLDGETNQDMAIASLAAQGANMAVYSTYDSQGGWVDMINRVIHPDAGNFPVGVIRLPCFPRAGSSCRATIRRAGCVGRRSDDEHTAGNERGLPGRGPPREWTDNLHCIGGLRFQLRCGPKRKFHLSHDGTLHECGSRGGGQCTDLHFDQRSFRWFDWKLLRSGHRRLVLREGDSRHFDHGDGADVE